MPTVSLKSLRDAATEIVDGFTTAQAAVSDAVRSGNATDAQYRFLGAELRGIEQSIKALRTTLDATDMAEQMVYEDGAILLTLWRWERGLRRDLVRFELAVRAMIELADTLERGDDSQVYVSRSGETLQTIAQKTLGDWREWPRLLSANPSVEPGTLPSGTVLTIPKPR